MKQKNYRYPTPYPSKINYDNYTTQAFGRIIKVIGWTKTLIGLTCETSIVLTYIRVRVATSRTMYKL